MLKKIKELFESSKTNSDVFDNSSELTNSNSDVFDNSSELAGQKGDSNSDVFDNSSELAGQNQKRQTKHGQILTSSKTLVPAKTSKKHTYEAKFPMEENLEANSDVFEKKSELLIRTRKRVSELEHDFGEIQPISKAISDLLHNNDFTTKDLLDAIPQGIDLHTHATQLQLNFEKYLNAAKELHHLSLKILIKYLCTKSYLGIISWRRAYTLTGSINRARFNQAINELTKEGYIILTDTEDPLVAKKWVKYEKKPGVKPMQFLRDVPENQYDTHYYDCGVPNHIKNHLDDYCEKEEEEIHELTKLKAIERKNKLSRGLPRWQRCYEALKRKYGSHGLVTSKEAYNYLYFELEIIKSSKSWTELEAHFLKKGILSQIDNSPVGTYRIENIEE